MELGDKLGCNGHLEGASSCREARVWASISGKLRIGSRIVHKSTDRAKQQLEAIDKELASNVHNLGVWAEESKDLHLIRTAKQWKTDVAKWIFSRRAS